MLRILDNLSYHKGTPPYIDKIIGLRLIFGVRISGINRGVNLMMKV
jgi:hypothetical protein